jgi:hypothetical protein
MISSPRGLPTLDVELERERLEEALKPHMSTHGRVELQWLDEVSWDGLHDKLLERAWHVLHFIGHGTYDTDTDEGVLAFVGRDGRADYVSASSLADLLDEAEPTPRLVVLNSCQSGRGSATDLFSGTPRRSRTAASAPSPQCSSRSATPRRSPSHAASTRHWRTAAASTKRLRSGRIGILGSGAGRSSG